MIHTKQMLNKDFILGLYGYVVHSLANVGNGVHPATYAHLIPNIGWVAELMDNSNMVWVWTAEELFLQSQRINLEMNVEKSISVKYCALNISNTLYRAKNSLYSI